jgi:uncharacterized protein YbjT (DUF2867 family)
MNVLVVGATGQLGSRICSGLLRQGHQVRGLTRPGSARSGELQQAGVEVIHGDLRDAASLDAATRGMQVIVSTATAVVSAGPGNSLAAVDRDGHKALLAAAVKNGVQKFVFVSLSPNLPEVSPLIACKRDIERAVRASGLKWTILQPSYFMEIWFGPELGWDLRQGKGQYFGPGAARANGISIEDVAAYGIASVTEPKSDNQDIPLGGPEALSPVEVVRIFEQVSGRKFRIKKIPLLIPRIAAVVLRPFNPKLASLMAFGAISDRDDLIDLTQARRIFGLPGTSVAEFAKKQLAG